MGAQGMILLIAIVVLLFPLATPMVSQSCTRLDEMMNQETVEPLFANCRSEFTHSVEANQDLQSRDIDQDTVDKHIRRPNACPIRRKLAELNCEPHCGKERDRSSSKIYMKPIPFTVSKAATGGGINNTTIIAVVVSTAAVTFVLATLLFCWYKRTYGGVQNDEKPLLSLSRGTSQRPSYSMQNSVKDPGKNGDALFGTSTSLPKQLSSVNSSVSLGIEPPSRILSASGIPPLKPPPGRPDLALKTPPGWTDVSVQCPPVSTHSPPDQSPVAAAQFARVPSSKQPPLAKQPPSAAPSPPPPPLMKSPVPPPPPGGARPPPRPPGPGFKVSRPSSEPGEPKGDDSSKTKLKPFFWDKVNTANPDQAMVWSQIRAGSFQFNEEMIENLFGYHAAEKNKGNNNNKKTSLQDPSSNLVQIIEPKKAQNLSILLKALNVTTNEVCDALKEGSELPVELLQTLLKMAPTGEEELKLRLYNGDISRLGTAERFLKVLVEIPFVFKRLESLLFMCTLQEEQDVMKDSFQTLEAACVQLKKSRLFLKLLEAVLKTGNRMNDGTFRGSATAFKLDTLLKLSDVKGVDGKTTLLHFVVLEIIRAEGIRAARTAEQTKKSSSFSSVELLEESVNTSQDSDEYYRNLGLQVVSSLSNELDDVKKASILDAEGLTGTVSKFGQSLIKAREFLNTELKNINQERSDNEEDADEFSVILSNFTQDAEKDVMWMLEEEKRIMALVKDTADYFHGQAGKDEGLRLFVIVRDFLIILDKVCKEIKNNPVVRPFKMTLKKDGSSSETKDVSEPKITQASDVSEPKITQTTDVSEPRMTQTEDVSSPRTHETDDVQHEKRENGNLQRTTLENEDMKHGTQETDDSRTQKTDDLKHETHEHKDLQPGTEKHDDSRHESQKKNVEETSRKESETNKVPFRAPHERLIPAIALRRVDTFSSSSSSDDD